MLAQSCATRLVEKEGWLATGMNRRRNANEKVLQISFVPAHSLLIILITHVNAPRSKNIVRGVFLMYEKARTAKWLRGCISAEYTKGAAAKSHFSANERGMLYTH